MTDMPIGTRVRVWDTNWNSLGLGTYMGLRPLRDVLEVPEAITTTTPPAEIIDGAGSDVVDVLIASGATTPEIKLDSSATIYGFECYWKEAEHA